MNVRIEQKLLLESIEQINKAIDTSSPYLPLRNILLKINKQEITIIGSDANLSIKKTINVNDNNVEVIEKSDILIFSTLFTNIIKKCNGIITLSSSNSKILKIENEGNVFEINLLNADEYPEIDFELYGSKINIDVDKFREGIKSVIFCASQKDENIILGGINIKQKNHQMLLTATDGARLSQEIIDIKDDRNLGLDITVNSQSLKEFIPNEANGELEFYFNEQKINLIYDNLVIQSKLYEAPYKNLENIFPTNFAGELHINKKTINDSINKAIIINDDNNNRLTIEINNQEIVFTSNKQEIGSAKVSINEGYEYNGAEMVININHKFLKEALAHIEGDVLIKFNGPNAPIMIENKSNVNNKQLISLLRG